MKKLMIAMSLVICGLKMNAMAGPQWRVPHADDPQALLTASYGGVDYATSSFRNDYSTVTFSTATMAGDYRIYGVTFSSGNCGDFVDVWDSTSSQPSFLNTLTPTTRLYNTVGSTGTAVIPIGNTCFGFVPAGPVGIPMRYRNGAMWRPSSTGYNSINLHFWKEQEGN